MKFASSGIVIASEFPIIERARQPFARGSCAGFDCLSNKGLAFARIIVPSMPMSIDLFNTHMNSTRASRVSPRRHLAAHRKQSREAMGFIAARADLRTPTIFGGDFKHAPLRGAFRRIRPLEAADARSSLLSQPARSCDVRLSWGGDEPWMDTQDLQLFRSGAVVKIRPK